MSTSELLFGYRLGDMVSLPMPKVKTDDLVDFVKARYSIEHSTVERLGVNYLVSNYKDKFCNMNEYFYAVGDLILEYKNWSSSKVNGGSYGGYANGGTLTRTASTDTENTLVKKNVQKHFDNYLFHCAGGLNKKLTQNELTGKSLCYYFRKFIELSETYITICIYRE
jgi:hypothetical protein